MKNNCKRICLMEEKLEPKQALSNIIIDNHYRIINQEENNKLIDGLTILDCNYDKKYSKIFMANKSGELFWIDQSGLVFSAKYDFYMDEIGVFIKSFCDKENHAEFKKVFNKVFRQIQGNK